MKIVLNLFIFLFLLSQIAFAKNEDTSYHYLIEPTFGATFHESHVYENYGLDLELLLPDHKFGIGILVDIEGSSNQGYNIFYGTTISYLTDNNWKLSVGNGVFKINDVQKPFFRLAAGYEYSHPKYKNKEFFPDLLIPTIMVDHYSTHTSLTFVLGLGFIY
jgi:hypothetical protein